MAQPLGVVDVLVSGKPTEHRLPQHTDKSVPAVFAGAGVGKPLAGQNRKAECVVEFAVGKQPSIGGDDRTAKLKRQSAVVVEPGGHLGRGTVLELSGPYSRTSSFI